MTSRNATLPWRTWSTARCSAGPSALGSSTGPSAQRPLPHLGDELLVLLVVVVRAVVADQDQQRQLVVDRGPQRRAGHHEVAVADHRHRQLPGVLVRQRHAHGAAGAIAQPATAALAAILARLRELPDPRR